MPEQEDEPEPDFPDEEFDDEIEEFRRRLESVQTSPAPVRINLSFQPQALGLKS